VRVLGRNQRLDSIRGDIETAQEKAGQPTALMDDKRDLLGSSFEFRVCLPLRL
jgi:hypothetical protein